VPAGAGLGGGSSDAAAVLRILNALAPEPLDSDTLFGLGAMLGSDIPFLLSPSVMALAWGRGERMLELAPLPRKPVLIAVPEFQVSTADAYAALDRAGAAPSKPRITTLPDLSSWGAVAAAAHNDFEGVVGAEHPEIPRLISTLKLAGAQISRMTGTGSAVFAIFDHAPLALPMMNSRMNLLTTLTASSVVPITVLD
jgi:4-diphosphocytidyl-2-C-methyl-D-erythritol kinase